MSTTNTDSDGKFRASHISDSAPTEQMMSLAFEASPNGMVMANEVGRIVLANTATEKMFGYTRDALIGQPIELLIPTKFQSRHPRHRKSYFEQPKSRAMGQGRDLYGLHRSGREFPVEIGLNPIHTEQGLFVLAAIVDITDRKHAEEMMYLAVEASPNGMVMMDHNGKILLANSTTEEMFGYPREEIIGQPIEILVPKRFRDQHPKLRSQYFVDLKTRAMGKGRDLYGLRRNGEEFPVEIGLNPITSHLGSLVLAAIVDITERKQQESLILDTLREKETLLAEIHHRVKNNLQIIDSLLGIQSEQLGDDGSKRVLQECQNRVKSMAIIHRTLYESQDFSGVNFAIVVSTLLENLVNSYANSREHIQLQINVKDVDLPINIGIPLGLIINELCSNVLKHAYPNNTSGPMRVSLYNNKDRLYVLEVSDEGCGIPNDLKILGGNTLGLMLVQMLSEQIEGELEINTRNPTRFCLSFRNP